MVLIMCNNLEWFVYVSISVKYSIVIFVVVVFVGEREGGVHRAHFWFTGRKLWRKTKI